MSKSNLIVFLFKMIFFAFALTTALLLLLAFFLFKFKWDTAMTTFGVYATYLISCLFPSFLTGKKMRSRRLLWGLAVSALYFLLFFIISLALGTGLFQEASRIFFILALCLTGGALGGLLS